MKKIVYASDFDPHDVAALKKTAEFASIYKAVITVLHIFFAEEKTDNSVMAFKKKLAEHLKYSELQYDFRVSENINEAIADYLAENGADLLVMFEKEKGLIGKLFEDDIVKRFSIHTSVPLLSYNTHSLTPEE